MTTSSDCFLDSSVVAAAADIALRSLGTVAGN